MGNRDQHYDHEVMTDYFFQQHQIATELMLGLVDDNARKIASKWLQFLFDEDTIDKDTSAKLLIVQGLILMLNANTLVAPLNTSPTSDTDITSLSQCNFIHLINSELNKLRHPQLPPKVQYEVSEDRKEYVAYQKIPGYGSHFCYVYSGDPIVKTEHESGVPILDETVSLEETVHPLIQKYQDEIRSALPFERTPAKFQYHDLTSSFGGMKIPAVDPEEDVEKEYELVNTDGEIGAANSLVASDLDGSSDQYDQFAQDPAHHENPRQGLKETILDKEREQRALLEERLINQNLVRPEPSSTLYATPTFKRTLSTRVKAIHLKPISLGGSQLAFVGRVPKESMEVTPSIKRTSLVPGATIKRTSLVPGASITRTSLVPSARRDLIQAMRDLEEELHNTKSSDSSSISSTIQHKIDQVWENPLMRDLKPLQRLSLPPPPKLNFQNDSLDKNQSY